MNRVSFNRGDLSDKGQEGDEGGGRRRRVRIPPSPSQTFSHRHRGPAESSTQLNCLLCLQQLSQEEEEEEEVKVTEKNPQMTIEEIQSIINYLTGAGIVGVNNGNPVTVPNNLPLKMMCRSCHNILIELGWLHRELLRIQWLIQKQTELAREKIVTSSRVELEGRSSSSLQQRFNSRIPSTSRMSANEVDAVTKFVEQLHSKLSSEGSRRKRVRFPSYLPQDFVPDSDSPPKSKSYQQLQQQLPRCSVRLSRCDDLFSSRIKTWSTSSSPPGSPDAFYPISDNTDEDLMTPPPRSSSDMSMSWDKHRNKVICKANGDDPVIKVESEKTAVGEQNLLGVMTDLLAEIKSMDKPPPVPCPPGEATLPPKTNRKRKRGGTVPTGKTKLVEKIIRKRKRSKLKSRRVLDGVRVWVLQTCDLCGVKVAIKEIVSHLDESHHVKDYIKTCPNPACSKVFSCRGKLDRHLSHGTSSDCRLAANLPKSPSTIKCDVCNKEVSRNRLLNHLQRHEYQVKDKSLSCPIPGCPDRYSFRQSVEVHISAHDLRPPKKSTQECSVCRQLIELEDVVDHLKEVHKVEEPIPCQRCPFQFPDWESLLDHLYVHRLRRFTGDGGGLSCDLCKDTIGIKFMRYDKLREHFFSEHNIGKQFSCENCHMEFFSKGALTLHQRKTHPREEGDLEPVKVSKRIFKCDLCPDVVYIQKDSLLSHNVRVHGAPPIPCNFCNELFTSLSNLHQHERQEHLGHRKTFKCNMGGCDRIFQNMACFRRHKRHSHNTTPAGSKQFICETCGKGYNLKQSLNSHVNSAHLGKRRPKRICEICGESFATTTSLRRHALIHSLERPHQCSICGQTFRQKGVLQTHLKSHQDKGDSFKPNGPMKNIRRRVANCKK